MQKASQGDAGDGTLSKTLESDPVVAVEAPLEVAPLKAIAWAPLDNARRALVETEAVTDVAQPVREALRITGLMGFLIKAINGRGIM